CCSHGNGSTYIF
nr:immunoglobulin light chain junction region [Macaca mulatta]